MAAALQRPGLMTFGIELELYLKPESNNTIAQMIRHQYIVPENEGDANRLKSRNRMSVLRTVAGYLQDAGVEAGVLETDDPNDPYEEWRVKSDPTLVGLPSKGFCEYIPMLRANHCPSSYAPHPTVSPSHLTIRQPADLECAGQGG